MTELTSQAVETAVEVAAKGPLLAVKGFFTSYKVKIIIALVAAAIAVGGFLIVQNHWLINKNVATKVENHDQKATIQSYQTKSKVDDASAKIDQQFAQKHEQTEKEYVYVRQSIQQAPSQDRNAPASPVVIDTLNGLERLHHGTEGGVPNADVPVG
jgi:ABC-type sugar transport system ATPase subunit